MCVCVCRIPTVHMYVQQCVGSITNMCYLLFAVPPSAPMIISVSASSSSSLLVTWTSPDNDGGGAIMSYIIEYRPTDETEGPFSSVVVGAGVPLQAAVHNLTAYTFYDVRITATNVAGNGNTSTTFQPPAQTHPGGLQTHTHTRKHLVDCFLAQLPMRLIH